MKLVSNLLLILAGFCIGTVMQCSTLPAADSKPARPNVLVILADDLGYSDLGCYGGEIKTPQLDALAANGLRFTQFYNTARCWPSRAVLLTGYYAQQVRRDTVEGIQSGSQGKRPAWARLIPELLKPAGYRAYHSGKWHVDGEPLKSGFDHSFEIGGGQNNYFKVNGITDDGVQIAANAKHYTTTATADHAVRCLKDHASQHGDKPFFHYLCFTSPHFPLHALPEDIAKYRELYRAGWNSIQSRRFDRIYQMGLTTNALPMMERDVGPPYHFPKAFEILGSGEINRPLPWSQLNDDQRDFQSAKMAIHAAMVDRMDQDIGRVLDQLRAMNAFDNTLILFASDNGASAEIMVRGDGHDPQAAPGSASTYLCLGPGWSSTANTPFRRHKTWVHEGGISTPLIAHWPQGIKTRGELRHNPSHLIDVVPTVLELAGMKPSEELNGRPIPKAPGQSLVPTFARDGATKHDHLWWHHEGNRAIRVGDWKLVAAGKDAAWELYDLKADRGESNNLAETHPEKVREMSALWQQRSDEFRTIATADAPPNRKGK
jgi:arylsulfatase